MLLVMDSPTTMARPLASIVAGPGRGPVLIVDGDAAVRRILRLVLEGAGYTCLTCDGVEEGLVLIGTYRPKLVLAEVHIAGGGGQALARRLASGGGWRPRVALMSAYPRPPGGFEDYFLPKPIEFDQLLLLLDSIEKEPGW